MQRASSARRLRGLLACYLVIALLIGGKLVSIQVVNADQYRGLAARQAQREIELPASRGRLYDREGEPLAVSLRAATIYANPRELASHPTLTPAAVADQLSTVLDVSAAKLTAALSEDAGFVYLGRQLPRHVGLRVEGMRLPGVGVLEESRRVYPSDGLGAQVVGFAGVDGTGLAGLELSLDDILSGRPGMLRMERAPRGLEISTAPRQIKPPQAGSDVVLTLDLQIQAATETALASAVEQFKAESGSAVVMDPRSGEILAMASMPTFTQADIGSADMAARRNRAVTDMFEPGSVNKIITVSAALEEGVVTPSTKLKLPTELEIGDKLFDESHELSSDRLTVSQIMETSSNIGTIMLANKVGDRKLYDYLRAFGYGAETGLTFPGESPGLLPHPEQWSDTSLPTISIGQGVSATLLQVATAFSTLSNNGIWVQPTLVRGRVQPSGTVDPTQPPQRRRAVSAETARQVRTMLRGVIESGEGTCPACAIPGYHVAGKTGTAQKPSTNGLGYEPGAYVASFVGFAPADNPALVVAVALDEPRPNYYGGDTAGPTFQKIMSFSLRHRRVPPSVDAPDTPPVVTSSSAAATPQATTISNSEPPLWATQEAIAP